jgi:hypothetical protein
MKIPPDSYANEALRTNETGKHTNEPDRQTNEPGRQTNEPDIQTSGTIDAQRTITTRGRLQSQRVSRLASEQYGVVTWSQLRDAGISGATIGRRVHDGYLHRIHRRVYAVGHPGLSREGRWMAAVLAAGEDAALSHVAAAHAWMIWRGGSDVIDVVTSRPRRPVPGIQLHVSRSMGQDEVVVRERIRITSLPRTLLDLGDVLTPFQLANVLHESAFRGYMDTHGTNQLIARYRGRRKAVACLRSALRMRDMGSSGTRSMLEDRYLAALARWAAPAPLVNVPVRAGEMLYEVDLHWPEWRLCVEVDGPGHTRTATKLADAVRDQHLAEAGWNVLRCGHMHVAKHAKHVADYLRSTPRMNGRRMGTQ